MKISMLKQLIREAVRTELKAMEKRLKADIAEQINEALAHQPVDAISQSSIVPPAETSGVQALRERFIATQAAARGDDSDYSDIALGHEERSDWKTKASRRVSTKTPKVENPKTILDDGTAYASGLGILEWFKQSKDQSALDDHSQKLQQMKQTDDYVNSIINRNKKQ